MYKYRTVAFPGGAMTCVVRLADGAAIPLDPANNDYRAVLGWVALGNVIAPADPPAPLVAVEQKLVDDMAAAKAYQKLQTLAGMSRAEIQAWMTANVTNLAEARDALTTLAIAVSVLARISIK
jgi:hypothetical protein